MGGRCARVPSKIDFSVTPRQIPAPLEFVGLRPHGFRGVDGAYTDNSGLAMTLATAMADCEAGRSRLDCSERTIDVLLVDDSRPN